MIFLFSFSLHLDCCIIESMNPHTQSKVRLEGLTLILCRSHIHIKASYSSHLYILYIYTIDIQILTSNSTREFSQEVDQSIEITKGGLDLINWCTGQGRKHGELGKPKVINVDYVFLIIRNIVIHWMNIDNLMDQPIMEVIMLSIIML